MYSYSAGLDARRIPKTSFLVLKYREMSELRTRHGDVARFGPAIDAVSAFVTLSAMSS
jgi:hypothetical protein